MFNEMAPGPVNLHSVSYGVCSLPLPAFLPFGLSLDIPVALQLVAPDFCGLFFFFFFFVYFSALEEIIVAELETGSKMAGIWILV